MLPKSTCVAPARLLPLTVTTVPPLAGPDDTPRELTDGVAVGSAL
jgi:hypothetical protein